MRTDTSGNNRRKIKRWIARTAMTLAAASLPWFWWNTQEIQMTFRPWMAGLRSHSTSWSVVDNALLGIPIDGNMALRFVGFDPNNASHAQTASTWCNRGTYILYPRRLFFADEGRLMKNPAEAQFDPSIPWMQDRGVRVLITITATSDSQFSATLAEIPPRWGF